MIRINLAPPQERARRRSLASPAELARSLLYGVFFLALLGAPGAYWWTVASEISWLQAQIQRNEKEKAQLQTLITEGQRFKHEADELARRVNAIDGVARSQTRPAYLMDAMADMLPVDLWLTRVEEKGRNLRLAGSTYSSVALSDFMSNLKGSGAFKDVDLVESRQDLAKTPRVITFEVTCRFEI